MHPLRRAPSLLAVLALAGCQSGNKDSQPPAAPPPAAATAQAAPAAAPKPPPPPAPAAQPELSYLKSAGGEGEKCEWTRHPLSGEPSRVFPFDAACDRSMVSFSSDGKQGLVFTWPSGEGEVARAWRVDLTAKSGQPLDLKALPGGAGPQGPDKPSVSRLGFDAQGRPVALVTLAYNARAPKKGVITFEGESFQAPTGQGVPGLALAYRLEDGGWKRVEAKPSRFEAQGAPGLGVLDTEKTLTPAWSASLPETAPGSKVEGEAAAKLDAEAGEAAGEGWWMQLPAAEGTLYYRAREEGPRLTLGQPLFWDAGGGKRVPLKDVAEPDAYLGFQLQRGLLLVTAYGGYAAAHVWKLAGPERLKSVPEVYAPTFWPAP
jgi:hypothetical protein